MKPSTKKELKKQFTISKILMTIGALWIIIYGILVATKVIPNKVYDWDFDWPVLVLAGLFYILIPFSVRPGIWSRIWAIFLTAVSLVIIIGFFVGKNVSYSDLWTYLNPLPHLLMAIGSIFWILQG